MKNYTREEIRALAKKVAENHAKNCAGQPDIKGWDNNKRLSGKSLEEIAEKNDLTIKEVLESTVDLSTTKFEDLPPYWQQFNVFIAEDLISLMNELGGESLILALDLRDEGICAQYGAEAHKCWLKKPENSWARNSQLSRPFLQLEKKQREKEIQKLKILQAWLMDSVNA